jgi:hypothetical protein
MRRTVWGAVLATAVLLAGAGLVSRPDARDWSVQATAFARDAAGDVAAFADRGVAALRSGDAWRAAGDAWRAAGERLGDAIAAARHAREASPDLAERPGAGAPWTPALITDRAPLVAAGAGALLVITLALAWLGRPRGQRAALDMIRRGRPLAGIARRTHLSQDALRFLRRRNLARAGRSA